MSFFQDKINELINEGKEFLTEAAQKQVNIAKYGKFGKPAVLKPVTEKPLVQFTPTPDLPGLEGMNPDGVIRTTEDLLNHKNTIFPALEDEVIVQSPQEVELLQGRKTTPFEKQVRNIARERQLKENFETYATGPVGIIKKVPSTAAKALTKAQKLEQRIEAAIKEAPEFMQPALKAKNALKNKVRGLVQDIVELKKTKGVNLERLGLTDEASIEVAKKVPNKIKLSIKDLNNAIRGKKITHEDIVEMSEDYIKNPTQFTITDEAKALTDDLLVKTTEELQSITSRLAKSPNNEVLLAKQTDAIARQLDLFTASARFGSAAGRSLAFQKRTPKLFSERLRKATQKAIRSLDKEEASKLLKELAEAGGDPEKSVKIMHKFTKATLGEQILEFSYSSMLSGVGTHIRNMMGTSLNVISSLVRSPLELGVDVARSKVTGLPRTRVTGEGRVAISTLKESFPKALKELGMDTKKALTGGIVKQVKTDEFKNAPKIKGTLGEIVRFPLKMLAAEDRFFRNLVSDIQKAKFDLRKSKGLKIKNIQEKIDEEIAEALFQGELPESLKAVQRFLNEKNPLSEFFKFNFPYFKTPINIIKEGLLHSPAGLVNAFNIKSERYPKQMAKAIIGTAAYLPALSYASGTNEFGLPNIIGGVPRKAAERDEFFRLGMQPHSIWIPDNPLFEGRYISFKDFEPFATLLGMAADTGKAVREQGSLNMDTFHAGVNFLINNISDKSSLKAFGDINRLMAEHDTNVVERLEEYFGERLTMFVPNPVAGFARGIDPTIRETEGVTDTFLSTIPGASKTLPAKVDVFGREVQRKGGLFKQMISPIALSEVEMNQLDEELLDAGIIIPVISTTVDGVKLSGDSKEAYFKLAGNKRLNYLWKLVNSDGYKNSNNRLKEKLVLKAINKIDEHSKELFQHINKPLIDESLVSDKNNLENFFFEELRYEPKFFNLSESDLKKYVKTHFDLLKSNYSQ